MIVQSSKGDELLSRINTDAFFLCPADLEFAVAHNPRYMTSVARNARWEEFGRRFEQRGLHHAAITTQGRLNYFKKNSRLAALVGRILPRPVLQGIKRAIKL